MDLAIQVGKIEQFFIILIIVIDNIVLSKAETFIKEMGKAERCVERDKYVNINNIAK